jgi:hypothetical protein
MITFDFLHRAMIGDRPTDNEIRHRIDMAIDVFLRGLAGTEAAILGPQATAARSGKTRRKRQS